jgi:hypothetical protein
MSLLASAIASAFHAVCVPWRISMVDHFSMVTEEAPHAECEVAQGALRLAETRLPWHSVAGWEGSSLRTVADARRTIQTRVAEAA